MAVATQVRDVPLQAASHGFRTKTFGTILGRSIMVADLRRILAACPISAGAAEYSLAALDQNILGKPTASSRRLGFRNLCEFYALDPDVLLFRALRDLWNADAEAQPMLALLCATARDPILRSITPFLLGHRPGTTVTAEMISDEAERKFPGKFRPSPLRSLGRNAASSWEQAGLLYGRRDKERIRPQTRSISLTYALVLGDLCGRRGRALFDSLWTNMLDSSEEVLREHAVVASSQGWIDYRASGDVVEVTFRHLMREENTDERS